MNNKKLCLHYVCITFIIIVFSSCKSLKIQNRSENNKVPLSYDTSTDSANIALIHWKDYFLDNYLTQLIDSALINNQEVNIVLQEIQVNKNEVRAKKGEYLPYVGAGADLGIEKVGRHTSQGASDENTEIAPGVHTPEILPNYTFGVYATWEIDIWKKLRNSRKAALHRFLASMEGKNFLVTNLISEIASSYYELTALDNQLEIVKQNIQIQSNALEIVKLEKEATRVTELAVKKFEAEVYHTKSLQFEIQQQIVETENRINFLVGRFPQSIVRNSESFTDLKVDTIQLGIPSQLLGNRTDIKQAELELMASKLDVKVARAKFYPSISISAGVGYEAFNPAFLIKSPQSLLFSLAGGLAAPLINRNAIKANYFSANSKQLAAVYNYEQTILKAYIEVVNQVNSKTNLESIYELKIKQVAALNESVVISTSLFSSARADYMEVLLTQRDAIISKFELIETKKELLQNKVNLYRALGGGWR